MGRIKTTLIKRNAIEVIDRNPNKFTTDFNENKEIMKDLVELNSKKLRNVMAGYITRLMRQSLNKEI